MAHLHEETAEQRDIDERLMIQGVGIGADYATAKGYDGRLPDGMPHTVNAETGEVTLFPRRARDLAQLPDMGGGKAPTLNSAADRASRPANQTGNGQLYPGPGVLSALAVWNEAPVQVAYRVVLRDRNANGTRIFQASLTDSGFFAMPNGGLAHDGLYVELLNADYTPMTAPTTVRVTGLGFQNMEASF